MSHLWKYIFILCVLYVVIFAVRSYLNLEQTKKLLATAATFSRDYYIGDPQAPPITFVALGDSTVEGLGATSVTETLVYKIAAKQATAHQYVHVINLGENGATSQDVLDTQLTQLHSLTPTIVSITYGANDATHLQPVATYLDNTTKIVEALIKIKTIIYFSTTPDVSLIPALPLGFKQLVGMRAEAQNKAVVGVLQAKGITIIDLFNEGRLPARTSYASDNFHPNATGYTVWANLYP